MEEREKAAARQTVAVARRNRNRDMRLVQEALARAHLRQRHRSGPPGHGPGTMARVQRRAERASLRARRVLVRAVCR